MIDKIHNTRIKRTLELSSPEELTKQIPADSLVQETVLHGREVIHNILHRKDDRIFAVVGPCSIHDYDLAIDYAKKLLELKKKVDDKIFIVMRVYFEKPRTTGGWKGLVYDPDLNDTFDIEKGLFQARKILKEINELGIPTATECLDPIIIEYFSDLLSWVAIGARTTESQIHRQLSSGLSIPVGFKNGTLGNNDIAINAMKFSEKPQGFFGINREGKVCSLFTEGNKDTMLILRGGNNGPNYSSKHVKEVAKMIEDAGLNSRIVVDCSHANSNKDFSLQSKVLEDVIKQIQQGEKSICGVMLESNINEGNQKLVEKENLKYGVSITDQCLSFEDTEKIFLDAYDGLE